MTKLKTLLAGTAFLALTPSIAHAETTAAEAAEATDVGAEIIVLGFGQARQVQQISASDIALLTPGTSPLKAIEKLPGVNFQSADPFGAYEWSTRISLRGFSQNQLGFTLDEVPLGDMSYGNYNGLHISRAIISENVGSVTVAQGSGALGTASTSNLGGTLLFQSRAPSNEADLAAGATYGADDTIRGFVRIDSGDLGGGLKGYLSYAYYTTDKWKGFGKQRQHQVNAKLVREIGEGSITGYFAFSDRRENDYQDVSKDIVGRLGYNVDNISNNFPLAVAIARAYQTGAPFPAPYGTVDDVYFDASGLRQDYLGYIKFDAPLTDQLSMVTTGYYHHNKGAGLWYTPYVPTPGGAPISVRTTEYDINRGGVITKLVADMGSNKIELGAWYETNNFGQARRFYGLDNAATSSRDSLKFPANPFFTQWLFDFNTDTYQYHVADTLTLGDLTVNAGWKGVLVKNQANAIIAAGFPAGRLQAKDWFLPQAGLVYKLGDAELFASFTQNMRAFVSANAGPFGTTQLGFDTIKDSLKPETSDTYEIGARYRSGPLQASLAGYYVQFHDRLLSVPTAAGIVGAPSALQNVGDVESYGAEASLLYRVVEPLSLLLTYAYNHNTYQNDVVIRSAIPGGANTIFPTAGKTVVDSPRHMLKGEIVYDDKSLFGRVGANYMSKRFYSYTNDASVPGRLLVDASIGYRFGGEGFLGGFSIEGSVTNLTDKKYFATIGTNGYGNSGDNQTLLTGAPRQWFVTLRKGF